VTAGDGGQPNLIVNTVAAATVTMPPPDAAAGCR
jgi:hypothetical protein